MTRGTPILVFKWIPGETYLKFRSKPGNFKKVSLFSA